MDKVRCPYCVDGDGFKIMIPRDKRSVCVKCGHVVIPDSPAFISSCLRCMEPDRPIATR